MDTIRLVAFAVGGALAAWAVWRSVRPALGGPAFERTNYRGAAIVTGGGLALVMGVVVVEAVARLLDAAGVDAGPTTGRTIVCFAVVGFGLLGLLDDIGGTGESGGFRGHLAALAHGRLTTGGLKLFGGGALAVIAVAAVHPDASVARVLADGALVALAANLGNLFDRAPGRTVKVGAVAFLVLVAGSREPALLLGAGAATGAALGLLGADLREEMMLGDVGANALGAALGVATVVTGAPSTRVAVLVVVAALNALSEVVSFSRAIERVAPLRFLDRTGRRVVDPS